MLNYCITSIKYRELANSEIGYFRDLDRREEVFQIYYYRAGKLVLEDEYYDVPLWTPEQQNEFIQSMEELINNGGTVYGAFDNNICVGMATIATRFLGPNDELLNLNGLWVSQSYRKKGVARHLLQLVTKQAKKLGATGLYVSATPSKNTVTFYMNRGFKLAEKVDPELFALEPEDIHMVLYFEE